MTNFAYEEDRWSDPTPRLWVGEVETAANTFEVGFIASDGHNVAEVDVPKDRIPELIDMLQRILDGEG